MSAVLESSILILFITGGLVVSPINGMFEIDALDINIFESAKTTNEENSRTTNITVSQQERKRYLEVLQKETTKTMIATLVYLAIIEVFGLVGNSLVVWVYTGRQHWSATGVLIMTLSGFDLLANTIAIPGEIFTILHKWNLNNPAFCKIRLFSSAFATITAGMILVAIAVVRYRKVCHPHKWQITTRNAEVISLAIFALGILFSTPHAILNGRQTKKTQHTGIMAFVCGTDDKYKGSWLPLLNYIFLMLLHIVSSVILIVLYILIGIYVCKHRKVAISPFTTVSVTPTLNSKQRSDSFELTSDINESTEDATVNMCKSKEHSVKSGFKCDQTNRNLNVEDNDTHTPKSISTAANEILNESDPWSMFKWLDVIYCLQPTKCDSKCVKRDLSSFFTPPLNNNLLLQTEWMRASVAKAMDRTAVSKTNLRDSIQFSSAVDNHQAGTSSTGKLPETSSTVTLPSDLNERFLRRRMNEPISRRMSLITMGGYSQYSRPVSRTTTMLFIISGFSILGPLPYLILIIVKLTAPEVINNLSLVPCILYNLFARSYFLTSAVKPIIYIIFDRNFRQDCIKIFKL